MTYLIVGVTSPLRLELSTFSLHYNTLFELRRHNDNLRAHIDSKTSLYHPQGALIIRVHPSTASFRKRHHGATYISIQLEILTFLSTHLLKASQIHHSRVSLCFYPTPLWMVFMFFIQYPRKPFKTIILMFFFLQQYYCFSPPTISTPGVSAVLCLQIKPHHGNRNDCAGNKRTCMNGSMLKTEIQPL